MQSLKFLVSYLLPQFALFEPNQYKTRTLAIVKGNPSQEHPMAHSIASMLAPGQLIEIGDILVGVRPQLANCQSSFAFLYQTSVAFTE